ncbi:hypothetical protein QTN25_004451 [Entamoeba marina]
MKLLLITIILVLCFTSFAKRKEEPEAHEPYTPVHTKTQEPYTAVHPENEEPYTPLKPFKTEEEVVEEEPEVKDIGITPAVYN